MAHRIDAGCAIHHVFDVGHVTDRTVHHRAAESTARASSVLREASLETVVIVPVPIPVVTMTAPSLGEHHASRTRPGASSQ